MLLWPPWAFLKRGSDSSELALWPCVCQGTHARGGRFRHLRTGRGSEAEDGGKGKGLHGNERRCGESGGGGQALVFWGPTKNRCLEKKRGGGKSVNTRKVRLCAYFCVCLSCATSVGICPLVLDADSSLETREGLEKKGWPIPNPGRIRGGFSN